MIWMLDVSFEMIIVEEGIWSLITLLRFLSESTGKEKRKEKKRGMTKSGIRFCYYGHSFDCYLLHVSTNALEKSSKNRLNSKWATSFQYLCKCNTCRQISDLWWFIIKTNLSANRLFHLSPQWKKGLCQDHLALLVPQVHRGHRVSLESQVFQEAMLWDLQGLQDLLGHKDHQALKVQQVYNLHRILLNKQYSSQRAWKRAERSFS